MYTSNIFCHAQLCTNEYFDFNSFSAKGSNFLFPWYFERAIDYVDHPWGIYFHGYFLQFLNSNFLSFDLHDALQCVNIMVRLARYNDQSRFRGFKFFVDK